MFQRVRGFLLCLCEPDRQQRAVFGDELLSRYTLTHQSGGCSHTADGLCAAARAARSAFDHFHGVSNGPDRKYRGSALDTKGGRGTSRTRASRHTGLVKTPRDPYLDLPMGLDEALYVISRACWPWEHAGLRADSFAQLRTGPSAFALGAPRWHVKLRDFALTETRLVDISILNIAEIT